MWRKLLGSHSAGMSLWERAAQCVGSHMVWFQLSLKERLTVQLLQAKQSCFANRYTFRISSIYLSSFRSSHLWCGSHSPRLLFIKSQGVTNAKEQQGVVLLVQRCIASRSRQSKKDALGNSLTWWYAAGKCFSPPLLSWVESTDLLCNVADELSEKSLAQRKWGPLPVTLVLMLC